jgi:protein dithiol:quinone oxidoreductase
MIQKLSPRLILGAIAVFSFGLLAYAWMLQYGPERQQPCPLCVLQRYVYLLIGIAALIGALHQHIVHAITTALFALTGAGLATWQVLKGSEMTSCLRDPIGEFVNGLPTADLFPQYFFANGGCADKYFTLGLPVPVWSLICFGLIIFGCGVVILKAFLPPMNMDKNR